MKRLPLLPILTVLLPFATAAVAHDLGKGADAHPSYDETVKPPEVIRAPEWFFAQARTTPAKNPTQVDGAPVGTNRPAQAAPFAAFAPRVRVRWDEQFLFVESNGLPAHGMMVGITNWQQQAPLPQSYTGKNAWQIPLAPAPSKTPVSIKGRFLRGAIALAVNGIPIFNPQNNRGEVSQEIGELDQWGGHCGRADDYHYHAAPLHLQSAVGEGQPIAFALDGYAIYGLDEPDGSPPAGLDTFNGHASAALGYHYHSSKTYPYVNGGFHGEVVEREGQVDPQPRAQPVRPDLPPLRGATITGFSASPDERTFTLQYAVNGKPAAVNYAAGGDGSWKFQFAGADGTKREETYRAGDRRDPGGARRGGPPPEVESRLAKTKERGAFVLRSSAVAEGGALPVEFTGDGPGSTLPLEWSGAPAGTKSFALLMHHLDREGKSKGYWTLYNLPANVTHLDKNTTGVGTLGASFKGRIGYEPPHSQGPGAKQYVLTLYALSSAPQIATAPVTLEVLSAAIKDRTLASTDLTVVYARPGESERKPPGSANPPPPLQGAPSAPAARGPERRGGPDSSGLIKPSLADTIKINVYADNWFVLYINGRLTAVDSIEFTPHNVVSVDILPEYPMTIAIMAKDNADPKSGLEYGDHIGDGGFIIKFADGTVSNATWKAKSFFKGPLSHEAKNPKVEHTPIPDRWWAVDFDDRQWPNAVEFTEERVNPKQPFHEADFAGAKFIWTEDLDLDNTILFRTRIEKPGWQKRWNTKPDLDVTGAPFR